jgi:AcrR family transcriptional regulator
MGRPGDPNARIDLLAAAEQVFAARGLDQTKVEDITDRAGRSKGSFYLHFESKEDAFKQVVESMVARLSAFLDRGGAADFTSACSLDALFTATRAFGVEMFEFVWQNRGVMRLVLRGGQSANFSYLMDEFAGRVQRFTAESLKLGIKRGLYRRDLDVELVSMALAGAYDRIARQVCEADRKPDLARLLRMLDFAFMGGIGCDAVRAFLTGKSRTKPEARKRGRGPQRVRA